MTFHSGPLRDNDGGIKGQFIGAGAIILAAVITGVFVFISRSPGGSVPAPVPATQTSSSAPTPTLPSTPGTTSTTASSDVTIVSAMADQGNPGMNAGQYDVVLSTLQNQGNASATTTVKVTQAGFTPTITAFPEGGGRAVNGVALIAPFSTLTQLEIEVSGVGGSGSFELTGFATTVTCPAGTSYYQVTCTLSGS